MFRSSVPSFCPVLLAGFSVLALTQNDRGPRLFLLAEAMLELV
jgi:hypothetical protein